MSTYHKRARKRHLNQSTDLLEASKSLSNPFIHQFEPKTFDSNGFSPLNDINQSSKDNSWLANDICEQEGWTPYRHLGSLKQEDGMCYTSRQGKYVHEPNNRTILSADVMPHYSTRYGYGSNDIYNTSMIDRKNELFTGNIEKIPRHEERPIFDMMPTTTPKVGLEIPRDRVRLSHYKNDVQLETLQRDAPMDVNYRQDVGNKVDMYVNPRQSIKGDYVKSGIKGFGRSLVTKHWETHKPDQFKTMTDDDLLPTSGDKHAPYVQENFVMKIPQKHTHDTIGPAYQPNNQALVGKYAESKRQNFLMPEISNRKAQETIFNSTMPLVDTTIKDTTINTNHIGYVTQNQQTYMSNGQPVNTTLKDLNTEGYTQLNVNAPTKGHTVNTQELATTLKEQILDNRILGPSPSTKNRIYHAHAPTTLKEQSIENVQPANIYQGGTYLNNNTAFDTTMKELVDVDWTSFTQFSGPKQGVINNQFIDTTSKEQLLYSPQTYTQAPVTTYAKTYQPTDTTSKEQLLYSPQTYVNGPSSTLRSTQPLDTTIKEQTLDANKSFIDSVRTKIRMINNQPVDTTVKEQHITGYDVRNVTGNGIYVDNTHLDTTIKETTHAPSQSHITGNGIYIDNSHLDTTTKEMTIDDNRLGIAKLGSDYGYLSQVHDVPTTLKDTTIDQHSYGALLSDTKKQRMFTNNVDFRSIREQLQKYRTPTNNSVKVTVGPNSINAAFRKDDNRAPLPRQGVTESNQPRMTSSLTVKDRFVNPDLLARISR